MTVLWYNKQLCFVSTFVVKIATFANLQNVSCDFKKICTPQSIYNQTALSMSNNWFFHLNDKSAGIPRKLAEGIHTRIFFGEQVMVSLVEFAPHAKGTLHHHPEEQWGFLLKGSLQRVQGDETVDMKEGDFWLTPAHVPHTILEGEQGATVLDIFSPIRQAYNDAGEGFGEGTQKEP
jgi:quercetin dioxygenase-like cupin family protein